MASRQEMADSQDLALREEIARLETRLAQAKARLRGGSAAVSAPAADAVAHRPALTLGPAPSPAALLPFSGATSTATHFLLLLSDSALPVGAFAFSSGLESYLAHASSQRRGGATLSSFLPLSLSSFAATTLPFVLAAHRRPADLASLDDQLDAAVVCTVGRRASVAQGRALLGIWERSFRPVLGPREKGGEGTAGDDDGVAVLRAFASQLRESGPAVAAASVNGGGGGGDDLDVPPLVAAHLAPLFGAVCAVVGLTLRQTAYVFMLSHVKALISAAVRASMFGPYQAQKVLAGEQVRRMIDALIEREWDTPVEDAGQSVPVMDLWIGRHELLYSRIFNS
ncbi:hypothetical protein JDV02_004929 [Purpureocillium takamizusanense]|uniref:Urease accessory protein n=1 Tax=Purpureocillium takamizusanense TaxID=2060973 RepID=A0A9Q8QFH4_9HYPO|nr:uncharacterized protein JDV02_004929 [Purpureocillium takamizusanense]UNI18675.1 hypothetical protein JDV02_004929 [Purpureocillium takamizusanense]